MVRSKWITRRKNGFSGFGVGITGTGIVSVSRTIACDLESQKPSSGHAPAGLSSIIGTLYEYLLNMNVEMKHWYTEISGR